MKANVDILNPAQFDSPIKPADPLSRALTQPEIPAADSLPHSDIPGDRKAPLGQNATSMAPGRLFENAGLNEAMGMYLPATVAVRLINFARVLLLTWWMLPQQFGLLNMILLAINVLTPLCSLGLNEAFTRYVPQQETRGSMQRYAWRCLGLLLVVTAVSVALLCLFSKFLGEFFYAQVYVDAKFREEFGRDAPELAKVSAIVTGLVILYFYLLAMFKGLRMFRAVAIMETVHAMIFLGLAAVAMASDHRAAITLTAIYGASLALPVAYFGYHFFRSLRGWHAQNAHPTEDRWAARLLRFSVWTTLAGITWQVLVYYPSWYLTKVHGHFAVAIFSAPRQIGQFVLIGAVAVVTVVMTTVTKTWESRGRDAAQRQLSLAFRGSGLALLLGCAMMALAKDLIIRMFRSEYAPGADILPLHLLFFLIGAYLAFLPIHFQLIEKTRHLFWPWAVGVAANVLYAFWLAGPGRFVVHEMPAWKFASSFFDGWFVTGFNDPEGLAAAAWCGVFAIATALALCVVLVRAECVRLDRGTYVIIFTAGLLAMNSWILAGGTILILFLAFRTELIFSESELRRIIGYVWDAMRHVPTLGRAFGKRS